MDADVVIDNEFKTSQTDTLVRDGLEVECKLRIAHVHHDLNGDLRQFALFHFFDFERDQAVVNIACIAFGAGDGNFLTVFEDFGSVAAADNSGDTELTSNNSCVAGTAAAVGNNSAGLLHHRFPVRIGHVRNKDVSFLNQVHLFRTGNNTDLTGADLLTDSAAGYQDFAFAEKNEFLLNISLLLTALHGLGTSLKNIEFAVDAVFAPFNVHRTAVVFFNNTGVLGKLNDFVVVQSELAAFGFGNINHLHRASTGLVCVEDHLDLLAAENFTDDREFAHFHDGFVDKVFVRVHSALNNGFTEAIAGCNENDLIKAAFGIHRKHNTGSTLIGANHSLDTGGKGYISVIKAFVNAVRDRTVVVEGSEYFLHSCEHLFETDDVQVSFLLAGKGSVRKVFSSCRGTNSNGNFLLVALEPLIVFSDFFFELGRERSFFNPFTNFSAGLCQLFNIINV